MRESVTTLARSNIIRRLVSSSATRPSPQTFPARPVTLGSKSPPSVIVTRSTRGMLNSDASKSTSRPTTNTSPATIPLSRASATSSSAENIYGKAFELLDNGDLVEYTAEQLQLKLTLGSVLVRSFFHMRRWTRLMSFPHLSDQTVLRLLAPLGKHRVVTSCVLVFPHRYACHIL